MEVSEPLRRVALAFRQRDGEDCVVPAEAQTVDAVVALERVHVEVVVLHGVRLVVGEAEDDDLRGGEVRQVGEAVVVAVDNVNRDVG